MHTGKQCLKYRVFLEAKQIKPHKQSAQCTYCTAKINAFTNRMKKKKEQTQHIHKRNYSNMGQENSFGWKTTY